MCRPKSNKWKPKDGDVYLSKTGRLMQRIKTGAPRLFFNADQLKLFAEMYANQRNEDVAATFNLHPHMVYRIANRYGFKKDEKYRSKVNSDNAKLAHSKRKTEAALKARHERYLELRQLSGD